MTAYRDIYIKRLLNSRIITAGDSHTSTSIDLGDYTNNGEFGASIVLTGSGRVDVSYELSYDNVTYVLPTTAFDIYTGFSATSGAASNGKDIIEFTPEVARYIRLKVDEVSTTDDVVATIWLGIH